MRLTITTPLAIVVEEDDVIVVSAEDDSGGFGILPGHADFLTSLTIGVLSWKGREGTRHYCAVRGGVLSVSTGREVAIATREAVAGDDLSLLDRTVLARFQSGIEAERAELADSTRMQLTAIRQIVRNLRPSGRGAGEFA